MGTADSPWQQGHQSLERWETLVKQLTDLGASKGTVKAADCFSDPIGS